MKKRYQIIIALAIIIFIVMASVVLYNRIVENGKDYHIEEVKQYNYFVLKQNDFYGVIDRKGNRIIPPEYEEIKIPNPEKAIFIGYQGDNTKVLNERNEPILVQYENVQPIRLKNIASDLMYEKSVLKYEKDGKYGLVDFQEKQLTKPIYNEIDSLPYKQGELLVTQNGKYGIINIAGNKMVPIEYDKIAVDEYYTDENEYTYAGYVVATKTEEGYRYGYLNPKGKEILKTEYNDISRVTEIQDNDNVYLICAKNGQYGIYKNQEKILENEYQSIRYDMTNKVFVVEKSKKYGIVNLEGKLIVPVQYNQIDITGIYLYAEDEQGITVYNNNGTQANVGFHVSILNTTNETYKIKITSENETKYGVIDKDGRQLIGENYNYIEYLYENYFIVSNENGKLGVVDDNEKIKIEIKYDSLQRIEGTDLIQITLEQNTQIYAKNMDKICEMQNASIEVKDDFVKVYNDNEIKYFDKEGRELKSTEVYPNNKLFIKVQNNHYGYVDINGNLVVECQYDKAYEFNEYGFATVKKDAKWGAIAENGQEVVAPIYEITNQQEPSFIGEYYRVTYGFGEFYYTNGK